MVVCYLPSTLVDDQRQVTRIYRIKPINHNNKYPLKAENYILLPYFHPSFLPIFLANSDWLASHIYLLSARLDDSKEQCNLHLLNKLNNTKKLHDVEQNTTRESEKRWKGEPE